MYKVAWFDPCMAMVAHRLHLFSKYMHECKLSDEMLKLMKCMSANYLLAWATIPLCDMVALAHPPDDVIIVTFCGIIVPLYI